MHYRSFGRDDIEISEVGLGCWQMGGNWGVVEDSTAREILRTSLDNGVNILDTADVYGDGRSETTIGDYLGGKTDDLFIATKVGRGEGIYPDNYTPEAITLRIENSLRRLKVEALDLVQTHCIPLAAMQDGSAYECLRELQHQGKILRFGASVETMEEANWAIDHLPDLYSLQIIFNIFRQKPIAELFEKAKAHNTGIVARVPLASGLLTGKLTKNATFGATDHRNFNKDGAAFNVGETFAGLTFEKGVELVEQLKDIKDASQPMAQWALRWILDFEAISTVIPGASKVSQSEGNAAASELDPLPPEIHQELSRFYEDSIKDHIRGPY
jgi:aryl-alcohol dehydrogenase-like predicted oxidoreductase